MNAYCLTSFVVDIVNTSFLLQGGGGMKEKVVHSMEWDDGQEML